MTAAPPGPGPASGPRLVVRLRRLHGLLAAGAVAAAGVAALVFVLGVPVARALQWGLLGWSCAVALGALARLPVPGLGWPDPPETPIGVGWHGLRTVEGRMRRESRRHGTTGRPSGDAG